MNTYSCECCDPPKSYPFLRNLHRHERRHNPNYIPPKDRLKIAYESNPKECIQCGKIISYLQRLENRNIKFCCSSCAATFNNTGRIRSEDSRKLQSLLMKVKPLAGNAIFKIKKELVCINCNMTFFGSSAKYCSEKCRRKIRDPLLGFRLKGGYHEKSGRGKMGYFSGIFCNSTYECAFIYSCQKEGKIIKRNNKSFPYVDENGKERLYYPDFLVNDEYVEIKGYVTERDKCKFAQFPLPLKILGKKEMLPIVKMTLEDHNIKEIVELLEGAPPLEYFNCIVCNALSLKRKKRKNVFCGVDCSRKCTKVDRTRIELALSH